MHAKHLSALALSLAFLVFGSSSAFGQMVDKAVIKCLTPAGHTAKDGIHFPMETYAEAGITPPSGTPATAPMPGTYTMSGYTDIGGGMVQVTITAAGGVDTSGRYGAGYANQYLCVYRFYNVLDDATKLDSDVKGWSGDHRDGSFGRLPGQSVTFNINAPVSESWFKPADHPVGMTPGGGGGGSHSDAEFDAMQRRAEQAEAALAAAQTTISQQHTTIVNQQTTITTITTENTAVKTENTTLKQEIVILQSGKTGLELENSQLRVENASLKTENTTLKADNAAKDVIIAQKNAQLVAANKVIAAKNAALANQRTKIKAKNAVIKKLRKAKNSAITKWRAEKRKKNKFRNLYLGCLRDSHGNAAVLAAFEMENYGGSDLLDQADEVEDAEMLFEPSESDLSDDIAPLPTQEEADVAEAAAQADFELLSKDFFESKKSEEATQY